MKAPTDRQHARFAHKVERAWTSLTPAAPMPRGWREACRETLTRCPADGASRKLHMIVTSSLPLLRRGRQQKTPGYVGAVAAFVHAAVQKWPSLAVARELAQ